MEEWPNAVFYQSYILACYFDVKKIKSNFLFKEKRRRKGGGGRQTGRKEGEGGREEERKEGRTDGWTDRRTGMGRKGGRKGSYNTTPLTKGSETCYFNLLRSLRSVKWGDFLLHWMIVSLRQD